MMGFTICRFSIFIYGKMAIAFRRIPLVIYEHMYEGITCTDVPHGNENVQYSEV